MSAGHAIFIPRSALPPPIISRPGPWRLERPYHFQDGEVLLTLPVGFLFDLASIPKLFWNIVAPFELSIVAPLLHDFLYHYAGVPPEGTTKPTNARYTRKDADRLFYDLMELEGIGNVRRHLAWMAVRDFGWAAWGSGRVG